MKKHPITRLMLSVTSLVLIIASMMCMTVACSQNGDGENSSSATTASTVSTVDPDAGKYDDAGYLKDALPEVANLGVKIGMLYWSDVENPEFFVEDDGNGGTVELAINRRNARVESRLGVEIDYTGTPGNAKKRGDYITKIRILA